MLIRSICLLGCAAVFLTSAPSAQAVAPQHFTITYSADITIDPKRLNRGDFSDDMIRALSGVMGNTISVAEVTDTVSFDKDSYRIQSTGVVGRILASLMAKGTFVRTSEGRIVDGTLNTLRYVDIRSSNPCAYTQPPESPSKRNACKVSAAT